MAEYGVRAELLLIGDPIIAENGCGQTTDGYGIPMSPGAGPLTIMEDGPTNLPMDGYGFPDTSGLLPG